MITRESSVFVILKTYETTAISKNIRNRKRVIFTRSPRFIWR